MSRSIREWQQKVHELAVSKGFYDGATHTPKDTLAKLMLVVSELAEAAEEVRDGLVGVTYLSAGGKPEGFVTELADAVIRILDLAEWCGVDVEDAMYNKHVYNATRPHMHGKKA